MRINWNILVKLREIKTPKSKLINIDYDHLTKVLKAKQKLNQIK